MIFTQLIALGILAHQMFALCTDGKYYLTLCFLPTFGIRLTPVLRCSLHIALVIVCVLLLFWPQFTLLYFAVFILLSVVIASYYLRLSNHLIVAWTMLLLLCLDVFFQSGSPWTAKPTAFLFGGVRVIIVLTYFLSFFHKLNSEYLSKDQSCGASLAKLYLKDRNIRSPLIVKSLSFFAIYGTLVLEAALPILLMMPRTLLLGLCLAAAFQMQMGFLCHFHFSSVMYAGLSAFVPSEMWPKLAALPGTVAWYWLLLFVVAGALFGLRFGITSIHRYRLGAAIMQMFFGVYTLTVFAVCISLFRFGPLPSFHWSALGIRGLTVIGLVAFLFLLNGIGPYLGLKTEFSLAMFSNLRHDPWRHLLIPARWRPFNLASYVRIEDIDGLPAPGQHTGGWATDIALINFSKRDELVFSSYFFHEGLRLISQSVTPTPLIRVVYSENGLRHEVLDYARDPIPQHRRYLRAALFPFRLPIDPSVPYCS
jgi:hypothetical protein